MLVITGVHSYNQYWIPSTTIYILFHCSLFLLQITCNNKNEKMPNLCGYSKKILSLKLSSVENPDHPVQILCRPDGLVLSFAVKLSLLCVASISSWEEEIGQNLYVSLLFCKNFLCCLLRMESLKAICIMIYSLMLANILVSKFIFVFPYSSVLRFFRLFFLSH